MDAKVGKKTNEIKAPMPGMVLRMMVKQGDTIAKGDGLLVLEAMKMENIIKAPADGVIKQLMVAERDKVEKNQVMIQLD
jgi:biotin carboxyl carrier protein